MRDVGRMISEIRDAEVRLETVRQLQKVTRPRRQCYQNVEETLAHELENFVAAFAEWQSQAVPILERARDDIDTWPVDQFDLIQLRRSIQGTYKRGRDALAAAKRVGSANPSIISEKKRNSSGISFGSCGRLIWSSWKR